MISRLIEAISRKNAPVCVGLDPDLSFVPARLSDSCRSEMGDTLEAAAEAVYLFNKGIIDATADVVPAVKIQSAMYEQFGVPGISAFARTVDYAHEKSLLVIGDVKRGDIGSTSAAYARAHIGSVEIGGKKITPFGEDFCTVNPYLGTDGIEPFLKVCEEEDRGIFVLCKTSNPSSGEFQDVVVDGRPMYERVAEMIDRWAGKSMDGKYSNVGCVVGATYPEIGAAMRKAMPRSCMLVPGYGAQGASGADLAGFFDSDGQGAIVNSSRGIIAAWKNNRYQDYGEENYADAARAAALDMIRDITENI